MSVGSAGPLVRALAGVPLSEARLIFSLSVHFWVPVGKAPECAREADGREDRLTFGDCLATPAFVQAIVVPGDSERPEPRRFYECAYGDLAPSAPLPHVTFRLEE